MFALRHVSTLKRSPIKSEKVFSPFRMTEYFPSAFNSGKVHDVLKSLLKRRQFHVNTVNTADQEHSLKTRKKGETRGSFKCKGPHEY